MQEISERALQPERLSCADVARLVRAALRRAFPAVKFSVRSHVYGLGASIHVRWTDGPTTDQVGAVTEGFAGGGFDGAIDLAYRTYSWLLPDGSAQIAYSPGTQGSGGVRPAVITDPPHPGARLCSFGADYVFVEREISEAFRAELEAELGRRWGGREGYELSHGPHTWEGAVWRLSTERAR